MMINQFVLARPNKLKCNEILFYTKIRRRLFLILLLILLSADLYAQTMNNLPLLIIKPIENSSNAAKEMALGSTVEAMLQSALDKSLVLKAPVSGLVRDFTITGVRGRFNPSAGKSILLAEGSVSSIEKIVQFDLRIYDVFNGNLLDTFSLQIDSVTELRSQINSLVLQMETSLCRDVLSSLNVKTVPVSTEIYLDDVFIGYSDTTGSVEIDRIYPGSYNLKIIASGYKTYEDKIIIKPRSLSKVSATLSLEPGSAVIDSIPQGASITFDGKDLGKKTPLTLKDVEVGEHRVVLSLESYEIWDKKISVISREEQNIKASLQILKGNIMIQSEPKEMNIQLNGNIVGKTPLRMFDMEPGNYVFEVLGKNYETQVVTITVHPGKESELKIDMIKKKSALTIVASVEGASVYRLDSPTEKTLMGTAPMDKMLLEVGEYYFLVEKDGYYPETFRIDVTGAKNISIEAKMRYIPSVIRVETLPRGADIYLNNVYQGKSPMDITGLAPGTYTVDARTIDGNDQTTVKLDTGKSTEIKLKIPKKPENVMNGIILALITLASFFAVSIR